LKSRTVSTVRASFTVCTVNVLAAESKRLPRTISTEMLSTDDHAAIWYFWAPYHQLGAAAPAISFTVAGGRV